MQLHRRRQYQLPPYQAKCSSLIPVVTHGYPMIYTVEWYCLWHVWKLCDWENLRWSKDNTILFDIHIQKGIHMLHIHIFIHMFIYTYVSHIMTSCIMTAAYSWKCYDFARSIFTSLLKFWHQISYRHIDIFGKALFAMSGISNFLS